MAHGSRPKRRGITSCIASYVKDSHSTNRCSTTITRNRAGGASGVALTQPASKTGDRCANYTTTNCIRKGLLLLLLVITLNVSTLQPAARASSSTHEEEKEEEDRIQVLRNSVRSPRKSMMIRSSSIIRGGGRRSLMQNMQQAQYFVVDANGQGQFTSIQEAVSAVQDGQPATIQINAGTYTERVVVPASKPHMTWVGAGGYSTIIQYNLKAADIGTDGNPLTAYNAATVSVFAPNFVAKDIVFRNTQQAPPPGVEGYQAPALRISADMAAFYRCGFDGGQDTLLDDQGRHYFESCWVRGAIDFVFGDGRSFYQSCMLDSIAQGYGAVAAQDRVSASDNTGFAFVNCNVTGSGPIYLGRAMGPYSRIVFAYSYLDAILDPRGWDDWDHDVSKDQTVFFGQYKCFGPGADESQRVAWSHELSDDEAQPFLTTSFIDGQDWLQ